MAKCACGRPEGKKGSGICGICAAKGVKPAAAPTLTSYQKKEKEKNERVKAQMEADLEARKPEMEEMAKRAAQIQKEADEKKKAVAAIAADWTGQVMAVVGQVRALRTANPGVAGINAGVNGAGTTAGGNGKHPTNRAGDPLQFALPKDAHGASKADVFAKMHGYEGSDSAELKIRIKDADGDILVHIR